jgi:hypothetical protein
LEILWNDIATFMKLKLSRYCLHTTIPLLHMTITSPLKIRNNLLRLRTISSVFN